MGLSHQGNNGLFDTRGFRNSREVTCARRWNLLCVAVLLLLLSGCETKTMVAGQHGVVFNTWSVGGWKCKEDKIISPGRSVLIWDWERLYPVDNSIQSIGWGGVGEGTNTKEEDYVETRTLDGNEVGLAVEVKYHIDPKKICHVIQEVGTDNKRIRMLVGAVARSDIRTHMNTLRTTDFFNVSAVSVASQEIEKVLNLRLNPEGIIIDSVIPVDHRFERRLADGTIDRSYQEQIDLTQGKIQETEQELKKIATVVEKKKQEFNEAQARVNRLIEEAEGFKRQGTIRGDAYLEAKKNEAEKVLSTGLAEVEGLKKQIAALNGPGGEALLRLSLVKALVAKNPKFVVVNSSSSARGSGIDLNRIDTNELIKQAGIFAAVSEEKKEEKGSAQGKQETKTGTRLNLKP